MPTYLSVPSPYELVANPYHSVPTAAMEVEFRVRLDDRCVEYIVSISFASRYTNISHKQHPFPILSSILFCQKKNTFYYDDDLTCELHLFNRF